MKIYAIIASLFLIVSCAHLSDNSSAVNIDGTWRGEVESGTIVAIGDPPRSVPHRKATKDIFFNFKKEGGTVNGTICGNHLPGKCIPLDDIEIKGEKITFTFPSMIEPTMMEQTEIKTSCNGKLKGEQIELNIITERLILPMPGSMYARETEMRNRVNDIIGSRYKVDVATSIPKTGYLTYEITLERISKIPDNTVNY